MARHPGGERYLVELEALADEIPPASRLRRWLKDALRVARFRALRVSESTTLLPPSQLQPSADEEVSRRQADDGGSAGHVQDGAGEM
jgi:hypothetical protein